MIHVGELSCGELDEEEREIVIPKMFLISGASREVKMSCGILQVQQRFEGGGGGGHLQLWSCYLPPPPTPSSPGGQPGGAGVGLFPGVAALGPHPEGPSAAS